LYFDELPSIWKWVGKTGKPLAGVVLEEIAALGAMESAWFVILYLKRQTRKACFRTFPVRSPIDLPPQFWAGAKADMHPNVGPKSDCH
jgi:hypothetical protein